MRRFYLIQKHDVRIKLRILRFFLNSKKIKSATRISVIIFAEMVMYEEWKKQRKAVKDECEVIDAGSEVGQRSRDNFEK